MSWDLRSLKTLLKPSGMDRAKNNIYPVLSITMKHGLVDQSEKFKKRVASKNTDQYRVAYKNELVVGFPIDEGVLGFQTKYDAGIVSPAYNIWKLKDPTNTHVPYLERYLRSPHARWLYASKMQGAVARRRSLSKADFLNLEIPFPPFEDQILIVHVLTKVEGLIAQRKQHLQQLDDLLKSMFLDTFGDPVNNNQQLDIQPLGNFVTHLTSGGRGWSKYYSDSGKRFIRSLDVQMNSIGSDDVAYVIPPENKEAERTKVQVGDVLLTITGSKIGRACFVPGGFEEAYVSQHVAIIRTEGIDPVYLSYYLSMPNCGQRIIAKNQYGQAKPGLNFKQISMFDILVPNTGLQNRFVRLFHKIEKIKAQYEYSLGELTALYGSLSQRAFKGELDLSKVPLLKQEKILSDQSSHTIPDEPDTDIAFTGLYEKTSKQHEEEQATGNYQRSFQTLFDRYLDTLQGEGFDLSACASYIADQFTNEPGAVHSMTLEEYETYKSLIFKALTEKHLKQTRSRLKLGGREELGNQIVLFSMEKEQK